MQAGASTKAIIIGGGIGGLTTAIALQQAGIDVTVLERAEELLEVGSALPLWTNALRPLQKLGLGDELEMIGQPVTAAGGSTWEGGTLGELRCGEMLKKAGTNR